MFFRFVLETFPEGAKTPEAAWGSAWDGDQEDPGPGVRAAVAVLRDPGAGQGDDRPGGGHQGDQEDGGLRGQGGRGGHGGNGGKGRGQGSLWGRAPGLCGLHHGLGGGLAGAAELQHIPDDRLCCACAPQPLPRTGVSLQPVQLFSGLLLTAECVQLILGFNVVSMSVSWGWCKLTSNVNHCHNNVNSAMFSYFFSRLSFIHDFGYKGWNESYFHLFSRPNAKVNVFSSKETKFLQHKHIKEISRLWKYFNSMKSRCKPNTNTTHHLLLNKQI